jgi:hypothetical protein
MDLAFDEPLRMRNDFTTYGFALIQSEQLWDDYAAKAYIDFFIVRSTEVVSAWYQDFIDRGLARPFDTRFAADLVMRSTMNTVALTVHKLLGRELTVDPTASLQRLKTWMLGFAA